MEVTQIIIDGGGFDSKDDHEFMHSFTCIAQLRYLMANAYKHQILQLVLKKLIHFQILYFK